MSVVSIATLKSYFETGDFPTQSQFEDLIDTLQAAGSNQIYSASLDLTAAQIKTLNTIPLEIVAAPGTNKAIEIISSSCKYTYGGTPFTSTNLTLVVDTAVSEQASDPGTILTGTANWFGRLTVVPASGTQLVVNKSLKVKADADSAVGNSTATVYVLYRLITV